MFWTSCLQIGENLYTALQQFLTIFPELRKAPLTIAGESYAGKHIPSVGVQILWHKEEDEPINLQVKYLSTILFWTQPTDHHRPRLLEAKKKVIKRVKVLVLVFEKKRVNSSGRSVYRAWCRTDLIGYLTISRYFDTILVQCNAQTPNTAAPHSVFVSLSNGHFHQPFIVLWVTQRMTALTGFCESWSIS